MFPIKPGERNTLAGTMGELRSSHFHSGIDVRTEGRTGLPVYAAAMGYISRVAVSPSGYGNTLYILHPNGQTSVYAHLEKFNGPIADHVLKEQYRLKKSKVDLTMYQGKFIVQKGDVIAYSGNSGSSGGPHLHFDIRDEQQRPLNPLSYGFDEILDRTPPIAQNIFVKTLDKDSRVKGEFGTKKFKLRRVGNNYVLDEPIYAIGQLGLMLEAHDKLDNSRFRCGINTLTVEVGEKKTFGHQIDRFAFSEQREIYRHMSFENLVQDGDRLHKLYIDDGNKLKFYDSDDKKGKLYVTEGQELPVTITMIDTYGNKSMVSFKIIGKSMDPQNSSSVSKVATALLDNTMIVTVPKREESNEVRLNGLALTASYSTTSADHYLYDMRKELPEVAEVNSEFIPFEFKNTIAHGQKYNYYDDRLDIYFQKSSLFDTLYLETSYRYDSAKSRELWSLGRNTIPLRKSIKITLKPLESYDKSNMRVYNVSRKYESFEGGTWDGNTISFWTRSFGDYALMVDSIAPTIVPIRINKDNLMFKIRDERSGIKEYKVLVNQEWTLMYYDYKRNLIWSEKLDKNKPFSGAVKVSVTDKTGNERIYETTLN